MSNTPTDAESSETTLPVRFAIEAAQPDDLSPAATQLRNELLTTSESAIEVDDVNELVEFIETVKADIEADCRTDSSEDSKSASDSEHSEVTTSSTRSGNESETPSVVDASSQGVTSWSSSSTNDTGDTDSEDEAIETAEAISPGTGSENETVDSDETATQVTPTSQGSASFSAK